MNELRENFLTGELVLMASNRENRPIHFAEKEQDEFQVLEKDCPFCIGNESMTPGIVYKSDDNCCRIIQNKYPAIDKPMGFHEVVIDSKKHRKKIQNQSKNEVFQVLKGLKNRENFFYSKENIKYLQIFKNEGRDAGASIEHGHMQLIASSYVPKKILTISQNFSKYMEENKACYICSLKSGKDYFPFYENENFIGANMYSGIYAFGIDIFPKFHASSLSELGDDVLVDMADILIISIQRLCKIKNNISYNLLFFISPLENGINHDFHFFIQIVPRIGKIGGFELSTTNFINSVLPEKACRLLSEGN